GNMEEGSLRCDANVSVRRPGDGLGTRTEIKNLNSMRFVGRAIDYEARRQIELIEAGGEVVQETRLYDPERGETRAMRSKEEAHDYRYFPDPDLLPVVLDDGMIERIRAELPELPDAKRERLVGTFGLSRDIASVLVAEKATADYFETAAEGRDAKLVANWITTDLFGHLNRAGLEIDQSPIKAGDLGALTDLITDGSISGKIAKQVFQDMIASGKAPDRIVDEQGLKQISDTGAIETIIAEIIEANPAQVAKAKDNPKLIGWFVGQVMQKTKGQANPKVVNELLQKALG
ncbi:MAG: Asp-tRNA(Asn)/Glu-tRNA(Gln) amidotransferase subunit GatB, partial [Alphaproteobacteria bacterium]|nr:Asp-tRNA(Asn)/Glu-tRNA(Gln) amidotransferase subunit GatB [Alphaproteobacteria bacterium]